MAEPTLSDIFGVASIQDAATLSLQKADFASTGLTAAAANSAESLLVALILRSALLLTEENRLLDLPNRNVAVVYSGQDLINQGGGNVFLRDTYQISLYRVTTIEAVDPDNY